MLIEQLEQEERLARIAALRLTQRLLNHYRCCGLMPIPLHFLGQHLPQVTWAPENRLGHGKRTLAFSEILQLESHIDEPANSLIGPVYLVMPTLVLSRTNIPSRDFSSAPAFQPYTPLFPMSNLYPVPKRRRSGPPFQSRSGPC